MIQNLSLPIENTWLKKKDQIHLVDKIRSLKRDNIVNS